MTLATTALTTRTLDVPGATLTYDVRPTGAGSAPALLLIGLGGEYGQMGDPDAFAAKLREVLAADA